MENKWQYRKIGDVCVVERGSSPRPIDQFITEDGGGINWIKIGDTTESMYITETAQKIKPEGMKKSRYVEPGDFLLSNSMSFGRPYILKIDGCIHDGWLVLKDKDEIFDKRFLYYYLSSKATYQKFKHMAVGGVVNNLNSEMVRKIDVPVPSKDEQMDTADLLDKICNIISLRKRELNCLDDLIRARFVEMFGEPVTNPKGWPVKKLKELSIQINSGNTPKGGAENYVEEGITFFRSQNVWKDRLEMDDIAYIDAETHASMKKSSLKHGDILMTKTGRINTENSSLGRAALYEGEDDKANVNGHVYFIRLKPGINNKFVLRILVSPEYRDLIRSVCVGGIDKRQLNKEHIEDFPIICPPADMVNEYIALAERIAKSKAAVQKALDQVQLLFDSLMQEYFG